MSSRWLVVAGALATVATLVSLLRSGRLREKYAGLWLVFGLVVVVVASFPTLLDRLAQVIGVVLPSNLIFFAAIVLLVGVAMHLSTEVSRLEDETRVLAEEIALLDQRMSELTCGTAAADRPQSTETRERGSLAAPHRRGLDDGAQTED